MIKNNEILISIITVVFNGEKHLGETINSVLNQTYNNIEYIIIDGASTDSTLDIIKKYEDKLAYWVSEPDNGIYSAMNKGLEQCKGELIGIINADDWYEKNSIELVVNKYSETNFDICYGNLNFIHPDNSVKLIEAPRNIENMKRQMVLFHPTIFIKKACYLKYGFFDDSFRITGDYDLILRLYMRNLKFIKINALLANFREGGMSASFTLTNLKENIKTRKKNNVRSVFFKEFLIYIYFRLKNIL